MSDNGEIRLRSGSERDWGIVGIGPGRRRLRDNSDAFNSVRAPARDDEWECDLKQAAEYRQHAGECRKLALTARNEAERNQLMLMAEAWERMASDREAASRPAQT